MATTVTLRPLYHRQKECIAICFENSVELNGVIAKCAGAKWSRTHKTWWVPLDKESYRKLAETLNGKATIDITALRNYMVEKKNSKSNIVTAVPGKSGVSKEKLIPVMAGRSLKTQSKHEPIRTINAHVLPMVEQQLKLRDIVFRQLKRISEKFPRSFAC
jgi:hypothetical protein